MAFRELLGSIEKTTRSRMKDEVVNAGLSYATYLGQIVKNNPSKTAAQVLKRSDVNSFRKKTLGDLRGSLELLLRAGQQSAAKASIADLKQRLSELGIAEPTSYYLSEDYLNAILVDLDKNFNRLETDLRDLVTGAINGVKTPTMKVKGEDLKLHNEVADIREAAARAAVDRAFRRLNIRAEAGTSAAIQRVPTDLQESTYGNLDGEFTKTWWAAGPNPCHFCIELDGQTVPIGKPFKAPPGMRIYRDLMGPGAHPNCQCKLIIRKTGKPTPEDKEPTPPEKASQEAPKPRRVVPKADKVSADAVRKMDESEYQNLVSRIVDLLVSIFSKLFGRNI